MNDNQKNRVIQMRENGVSFSKISEITGISRNTIKSFCKRGNIVVKVQINTGNDKVVAGMQCKQCAKELNPVIGRKTPKFCSKECRTKWWNSHPEEVNRKAIYNFTCVGCGKAFTAYGNKGRKFCSHGCYINARFKVGEADE